MYQKEKSLLMPLSCAAAAGALAVERGVSGLTRAAWVHRNQVCLLLMDGEQVETRTVSGRTDDGAQQALQVNGRRDDTRAGTAVVVGRGPTLRYLRTMFSALFPVTCSVCCLPISRSVLSQIVR